MPHLVLEASLHALEDRDVQPLLDDLVDLFSSMETVQSAAVKARFVRYEHWATGEDAPPEFLHCGLWILEGRPAELKKQMADQMYELLAGRFKDPIEKGWLMVTLELREMAADTYRK